MHSQTNPAGGRNACWRFALIGLVLALGIVSCAPRAGTSDGAGLADSRPAGPKRVTAVILADLPSLAPSLGPLPGKGELLQLLNVGLSFLDADGVRQPILAETTPNIENGLWKVFPDGRMETTWTLRSGITWHDGTPFTIEDLLFTARVQQDRDLGVGIPASYSYIQSLDAVDQRTLRILWSSPYIWGDDILGNAVPMPRHLLERTHLENKENFYNLGHWADEFIGTGPFKLAEWVRGSHVTVKPNDTYILGRPKIDEIDVRFITDTNTLMTNIMSNAVQLTLSRGLSLEQALQLRQSWKEGRVVITPALQILMYPQLSPPAPAAMGDPRFRRALLHAINRQDLVDGLMSGQSAIAHTTLLRPTQPEYPLIESSIVKYDFDPRKATDIIDSLGFTKAADGFYRDAGGQRLAVEINTSPSNDIQPKSMFPVADFWQRAGVTVTPNAFPLAQVNDREFLMSRPGFYHVRHPHNLMNLDGYWTSARAGFPENRFAGNNYARYQNAELDALVQRFNATIPRPARMDILKQIVHHTTDQAVVFGLFYDVEVTAIPNDLLNMSGKGESAAKSWDSHRWDKR